MNAHKTKLRLRKNVAIAIPIAITLTIFIFGFIAILSHNNHVQINNLKNFTSGTSNKEPTHFDLSFLDSYNEAVQERRIENTINFYSQRFKLNKELVLNKAKELTNNFKDEKYLQTYTITYKKDSTEINPNQEAGIIRYVKTINSYPEKFGYTWEEIHLTDKRDTKRRYNENNQIIMANGDTFEQYVGKIANILELDPSLALAIIYNESGRCRSNLFKINNNVAGMKALDGWAKYATLEAGVISFELNLKAILNKYQMDPNTEQGLLDLSAVYVNGNLSVPAYNWYTNVSLIRKEVIAKDLFKKE